MFKTFDLIPQDRSMISRTPIHHIAREIMASNDSYHLEEIDYGHLILRTSVENKSCQSALKKVLKLELPNKPLSSNYNNEASIYWLSPDEYLILVAAGSEFEIETSLREHMQGHYAIVNVSGGQTALYLSGERASSVLQKSTPYNIQSHNFPVGKVVTTVFAKSQIVLSKTDEKTFLLIIRRSFSDYLWQWIIDAGSRK